MSDTLRPEHVFVAGGLPNVTYVPRDSRRLEQRLQDYLAARHKMLSISGPTKCGKTVLLRSVIRDPIWIPGANVDSIDSFWRICCDKLHLASETSTDHHFSSGGGSSTKLEGGVSIAGIGAKGGHDEHEEQSRTRGTSSRRVRPPALLATEELEHRKSIVVIDDFHYMPPDVQLRVVRGLKDPIFNGVAVVAASVPHRAFDAVRVEKEMTGRVEQLPIDFWQVDELLAIATKGFGALNLLDPDHLDARVASECFNSPFLMQDFCLNLCRANGIATRAEHPTVLRAPADWSAFFRDRASNAAKTTFDRLARGPKRTDRILRPLRRGGTTDIYGAVLEAIARTGPLTELKYEELATALRVVLTDSVPQQHEVTRVLEEMCKIAKADGGEPVVDFDADLRTLYISDPYLAYYLRWGIPH